MDSGGCFFGATDDMFSGEFFIFFVDGVDEVASVVEGEVWLCVNGAFDTSIEVVVVGISCEDVDAFIGEGCCNGIVC